MSMSPDHLQGTNFNGMNGKTLNRLRMGVGRSKDNVLKRGCLNDQDASRYCGTTQTMAHLSICLLAPGPCTQEDLTTAD